MEVKFYPVDPDVVLPSYASDGACAVDVCARLPGRDVLVLFPGDRVRMPLGFKAEIVGAALSYSRYGFLLLPRSGFGSRGLALANTLGLIDADYRGEWIAMLVHAGPKDAAPLTLVHGERILQAIPLLVPPIQVVRATAESDLTATARGAGGFGSTGTKEVA